MGKVERSDDPLFRPEAVAEQQDRWLGTVLLVPRPSWTLMVVLLGVLVAGIVGLLVFGEYTRKARLTGLLSPEQGLIQVVAPLSGVLTQVNAQEGLEVAAGTPLAVLSAERRSETVGATQGEVLRALRVRRDSLIAEREHYRALFAAQIAAQAARLAVIDAELAEMEREFELQRARVDLADTALARQRELRDRDLVVEQDLREAEEAALDQRLALQTLERERTTLERSRLELAAERDEAPLREGLQIADIDRQVAQIDQELAEAEARARGRHRRPAGGHADRAPGGRGRRRRGIGAADDAGARRRAARGATLRPEPRDRLRAAGAARAAALRRLSAPEVRTLLGHGHSRLARDGEPGRARRPSPGRPASGSPSRATIPSTG